MSKKIEKLETYTFQKKDDPREKAVELVIAILESHGAKLNELIEAHNELIGTQRQIAERVDSVDQSSQKSSRLRRERYGY